MIYRYCNRVAMDGGGEEEDATDPLVMCEPRELEMGLEARR